MWGVGGQQQQAPGAGVTRKEKQNGRGTSAEVPWVHEMRNGKARRKRGRGLSGWGNVEAVDHGKPVELLVSLVLGSKSFSSCLQVFVCHFIEHK